MPNNIYLPLDSYYFPLFILNILGNLDFISTFLELITPNSIISRINFASYGISTTATIINVNNAAFNGANSTLRCLNLLNTIAKSDIAPHQPYVKTISAKPFCAFAHP